MGRTRDFIQEIDEVRKRRKFNCANIEMPIRLISLDRAFRDHNPQDMETLRYFPIALVACVEGYFRIVIRDLIDAGEPYISNAEKPAFSLKLDYSILRAVHGKLITVGEIVAHGVQISRLEHVESIMTTLLGDGFLNKLRTTTYRFKQEVNGETSIPILANPDQVFRDVARTFELRHVICHEIASAYEVTFDEVSRCFESCVSFLKAVEEFVSTVLSPDAPLNQTDLNIAVAESLRGKRIELDEALVNLKARLDPEDIAVLDETQRKWELYCEAWADFVAREVEGGTMRPLIYGQAAESIVMQRIGDIVGYRGIAESPEKLQN